MSYLKSFLLVLESVELALLDHHLGLELARVGAGVAANEHRVASLNHLRFLLVIHHLTQLLNHIHTLLDAESCLYDRL